MEYLPLILSVTVIHLLAVISPGPDFIIAIKHSLTYSRKTGFFTALGFALGISVHLLYCVFWLALLISQSLLLFSIIKFLWAGYLIYIGVMSFLAKGSKIEIGTQTHKKDITWYQALKIGFLTNVLNPKATLFFLSLFTMVISPETPALILGVISSIMIINTALWFSLVAFFFTQAPVRTAFYRFESIFNKIFWGLLIGLGLKVAMIER